MMDMMDMKEEREEKGRGGEGRTNDLVEKILVDGESCKRLYMLNFSDIFL